MRHIYNVFKYWRMIYNRNTMCFYINVRFECPVMDVLIGNFDTCSPYTQFDLLGVWDVQIGLWANQRRPLAQTHGQV